MARKQIDIGTVGNDGTGDSIRDSFRKVNDNFRELYSSLGLGERLTFIALDDTPTSYVGRNDSATGATPVLTVNNTESGIAFKQLTGGVGVTIDFSKADEIVINTDFSAVELDTSPNLGGDLRAFTAGEQYRILDLGIPREAGEVSTKAYTDTKIALAGVDAIDPASPTGAANSAFGTMSGPLILSRNPEPDDDINFNGLIAATKNYVDNAAFGSVANLYVATSGSDDRPGLSKELQGRALAYAYRTIEAACRRAEELVLEARSELGPYKKVLTFNNGAGTCTLNFIGVAPDSGSGFDGTTRMSVDTVTIANRGRNYFVGDILQFKGGSAGSRATIQVLSVESIPGRAYGPIVTFKIISTGSYLDYLPGQDLETDPPAGGINIDAQIITSAAPVEIGAIGDGALFNLTYKVNSVRIKTLADDGFDGSGSGYSLVSVRIQPAPGDTSGSGAFGTAVVTAGKVTSITITDQGSGFTDIPSLTVNLPRFTIRTDFFRTDFTGNVTTDTPEAFRGRDIREGLFLRGENSGALAQILSHQGELDSDGNEIFDVDIKFGTFEIDEPISYGDVTKNIQITILVESGVYEENLPIKVPQNTSIVGDEFRRCIVRPRPGVSSSPWAFQKFRRDLVIDGLTTAVGNEFGYHYLTDSSQPVYPKINNKGAYTSAARLLELNRSFIQDEIIAWMDYNINRGAAPWTSFTYATALCKRDVGYIVDAIVFDLKWGGYNRTISAGLKYYQSESARFAISSTGQLSQYLLVLTRITELMQDIIDNVTVVDVKQTFVRQTVDLAFQSEIGADAVINELMAALRDVMDDASSDVNLPKLNENMDAFLANDAIRWQSITVQGVGGFFAVLDPEGQILAKSPYGQECACFSKSIDRPTFAGGMFVDGFTGNLQFTITSTNVPPGETSTRLSVTDLDRIPNLPCSFIVADTVYRVNYIRDFVYDKDGSSGTLILDETTPWPFPVFTYNQDACYRDAGLILTGVGYDILFATNYHQRKAGLAYRQANAEVVINDQRDITLRAIQLAHTEAISILPTGYTDAVEAIEQSSISIVEIIDRGPVAAPPLLFTLPPGLPTNLANAHTLLLDNIEYIKAEVIGWIAAQIAGSIPPFSGAFTYNPSRCARDVEYILQAVIYDLTYGGNEQTRDAGLKYYDGTYETITLQLAAGQESETAAAIDYASYLAQRVVQDLNPAVAYSVLTRVSGTAATIAEANLIDDLMSGISATVSGGVGSAPVLDPTEDHIDDYSYDVTSAAARQLLADNQTDIQDTVVDFVDTNGNLYELLMPGNRSMLANDWTQINDLGYGAIAHNGGLIELVSMFTYYCHISYYSLNGGQIRSVGGSSAHGNYALVAEGSDPLEVPTPTSLHEELSQRCRCYAPSPTYATTAGGLFVYVYGYDYEPLGSSELEVNHIDPSDDTGIIYRYPVTSASSLGLPPGVTRLNLSAGTGGASEGLLRVIPDNQLLTIRANGQVILTGNLVDVAVRPSTGLKLRETGDTVYRVLQFNAYTDNNGPYPLEITAGDPGLFRVLVEVTDIDSDICTTAQNHKLKTGDKFIPTSSANGLIADTTYYVIDVPEYNQFELSLAPGGPTATLTNGTGISVYGAKTHKLVENSAMTFVTTGTLPAPLTLGNDILYYVRASDLTDTEFTLSIQRGGTPVEITTAGSGIHSYNMFGLTRTILRENYDYNDLTLWQPGEFVTTGEVCTISIGSPAVISLAGHTFSAGDVIKFETTGNLPTGLSLTVNYHVLTTGLVAGVSFQVSTVPEGLAADTSGSQSGVHTVGLVTGRAGDQEFAIVPVASQEVSRLGGSKFVWLGIEYTITNYQSETVTGKPYARVIIDKPLEDSLINFGNAYTIKSSVPIRTSGSLGNLTIRISLTRVTSHDLLEIGTGSYADTNYPQEIYGPPVNPASAEPETEERDVGRCFYVTTDQFGNFSVGPYFKVDQGTGTVTFSASIALSNLDGIGFKRGVPVSEFSTDTSFSDNATDTVPTENATRVYIERRLGLTHSGGIVDGPNLIPVNIGGFMPLDGQLTMNGNMKLGSNKITGLGDPTELTDAVNLRSLTFSNFQDFSSGAINAADILVFTGDGRQTINATVVGDVTFNLRPGADSTLGLIDVQIVPDTIIDIDVKSDAAIAQSKLAMNAATTRADATGIAQANLGLASFNSAEFNSTNGWISLKNNGTSVTSLEQIATRTVLGNSTLSTANVSPVTFSTVVNDGGGIKKSQYSSTGFVQRTNAISSSSDSDYTVVDAAAGSSSNVEAGKLIIRDSLGDFGGRIVDISQLKLDSKVAVDSATTATGGFLRYYGWDTAGGILIQNGSLPSDKKTAYWNNTHNFKTQDGLSDAPITASSIQVQLLTTGGNTTPGKITGRWELTGTSPNESRLQSTYSADLAEYYEGDKEYEVGTVLVFGGDKEVTTTNTQGDNRVAGVVSNTAAFAMYEGCPGLKNLVALQGRVPCKVVGKIRKGEMLVTSQIPGVAIAGGDNIKVGTIVGKALVDYNSDDIGTIEIAVGRT
jgi:hypothetical protein